MMNLQYIFKGALDDQVRRIRALHEILSSLSARACL
jgi:hypothetical protein